MMKDPVCGMQVDETTAKDRSTYKGKEYAFCGPECKSSFDEDPESFIDSQNNGNIGMPQRKEKVGSGAPRAR